MGALFTIINYSIGNLFLGIIITIVGVVLMFYIIKSWFNHKTFTPISFIVGGILFLFLSFQSVLMCGAITIKSYTDDVEYAINEWVVNVSDTDTFDQDDSQIILDNIVKEWPLVGYFLNWADFSGHTSATIASAMAASIRVYMNWFILRRLLWILFFIIVGAVVVIKSMEGTRRSRRPRSYSSSYSSSSSSGRRKRYDY